MASSVYEIANFIGVVTFAFLGTKVAYEKGTKTVIALLCGFLSTFGGGAFFRDILLLQISPAVLSNGYEVAIAMFTSLVFFGFTFGHHISCLCESKSFNLLACLLDALGLGAFVSCGTEKGLIFSAPIPITLLCGLSTGVGGGIISSFFYQKSLRSILLSGIGYRMVALISAILYFQLRIDGTEIAIAQTLTIIFSVTACLILNTEFRSIISHRIGALAYLESDLLILSPLVICYRIIWYHCRAWRKTGIRGITKMAGRKKVYQIIYTYGCCYS